MLQPQNFGYFYTLLQIANRIFSRRIAHFLMRPWMTFLSCCVTGRGRSTWTNSKNLRVKVGEFVWQHLSAESQNEIKFVAAGAGCRSSAHETRQLEIVDQLGNRCRAWLWPLDSPEMAVCTLGIRIPSTLLLARLLAERDCLELLGSGHRNALIAEKLELSISTYVHTHSEACARETRIAEYRARSSVFAAKHCYPVGQPLDVRPAKWGFTATFRKRHGPLLHSPPGQQRHVEDGLCRYAFGFASLSSDILAFAT